MGGGVEGSFYAVTLAGMSRNNNGSGFRPPFSPRNCSSWFLYIDIDVVDCIDDLFDSFSPSFDQ